MGVELLAGRQSKFPLPGGCWMDETLEQLIAEVKNTQSQLASLLESGMDDQDWSPSAGEWSFREIAAHLLSLERECYLERVQRIAAGGNPRFESYLNTGRDFSGITLMDALNAWLSTRQEIIAFVSTLPADKLVLSGTHVVFGRLTVQDVIKLMRDHDLEHLRDLEKMVNNYEPET